MAIKLRRTLFIGLGGTGIETLLHIKRRLIETYSCEIPPMIGFLGIDTDSTTGGLKKEKRTSLADYEIVKLDASETCAITVSNPKDIYLRRQKEFSWIPNQNIDSLRNLEKGAGQVRTNGRFALLCNISKFEGALKSQLNKIKDSSIIDKQKYELIDNDVEIYVIGSIAGGTGCGSFIDVGFIINNYFETIKDRKFKVYANLFLPHVYKQMIGTDPSNPKTSNIYPNAYASLKDLDFLMHTGMKTPVYFNYPDGEKCYENPPYHGITLIDNSDHNGFTYDHVNKLEEMAAISLSLAVGDFGDTSSMMDNVLTYSTTGQMDILDKKSWAGGMGVCEISIDTNSLGNIYAYRYGQRVIQGIINTCDDTISIANNWIDNPRINIRENNGDTNNNLIDQLLSLQTYPFTLGDTSSIDAEAESFINSNLANKKDLNEKTRHFCVYLPEELDKMLQENLNQECGLGNVLGIISGLKKEISLYLSEMTSELEHHIGMSSSLESQFRAIKEELIAISTSFMPFGKRAKVNDCKSSLESIVNSIVRNSIETARKSEAKIIFSALYEEIMKREREYTALKGKLDDILNSFIGQASVLVNKKNDADKEFIIELMDKYATKVVVNDSELDYPSFFKQLLKKNENGLNDLKTMDQKTIERKIWDITSKSKKALEWRNINIEDVLKSFTVDERMAIFDRAVQKSNILLNYDHKGYVLTPSLASTFVVGVKDKNSSIVVDEKLVEKYVKGATEKVSYTSTNMNNNIVIYRQLYALPAFSLTPFDSCENEYSKKTNEGRFFHFDSDLCLTMEKNEYSINPRDEEGENVIQIWVQAILHKIIINENGVYKIKSRLKGDALDGYYVTLALENYRDDAFDNFCRKIEDYSSEIESVVNKAVKKMGDDEYQQFLDKMRKSDLGPEIEYYTNFSQINIEMSELRTNRNFVKIADLIRKEFDYLNNFLEE